MHTQSTITLRSIRVLSVTIALAVAGTIGFASNPASADVLTSAVSTGGSGGDSVFAEDIDDDTVSAATASYEDLLVRNTTPTLVGSGPERETIAHSNTPFVGSTQNERSIQMTESKYALADTEQAPWATSPHQTIF